MKKLTLAISEEEHRKLKLISATTGETMVGIVLKCIRARYKKLEEDVEKEEKLQSIIKRLRRQKMEFNENYEEMGYESGFLWAEEADYEQIQAILPWNPNESFPQDDCLYELSEDLRNATEGDENISWNDWREERYNEYNDKWLKGWKDGVSEFWSKIKTKI